MLNICSNKIKFPQQLKFNLKMILISVKMTAKYFTNENYNGIVPINSDNGNWNFIIGPCPAASEYYAKQSSI